MRPVAITTLVSLSIGAILLAPFDAGYGETCSSGDHRQSLIVNSVELVNIPEVPSRGVNFSIRVKHIESCNIFDTYKDF